MSSQAPILTGHAHLNALARPLAQLELELERIRVVRGRTDRM